jgi:periplasmic divalent cation tolerance protein
MADFQIALCTCADLEQAQQIARHLVEERLASCVNILPQMQSIYRWQGKVETAEEFLLIIKTDSEHSQEAQDAVTRLHSYEVPEFLLLPVTGGSAAYLHWLKTTME